MLPLELAEWLGSSYCIQACVYIEVRWLYSPLQVVSAEVVSGDKMQLREHWSVGKGGSFQQGIVGTWSPATGIQRPVLQHKYDRRKNLMGYKMIVSTIKVSM